MNNTSKIILLLVLIAVGVYLIFFMGNSESPSVVLDGEEITFAEVGNITFNNPGMEEGLFFLVYEEPGQPALTQKLLFDSNSICLIQGEAGACEELALEDLLPEERAGIEGVEEEDGVLVRKLTIPREGQDVRLPEEGSVLIDWDLAVRSIEECQVNGVVQTHALDIYLEMKDGTRLRTVSPEIDDVFEIVAGAQEECGDIYIATE